MSEGRPAESDAIRGADVEVLIPTYEREAALAVTLTGLVGQQVLPGRVRVADQSEAGVAE